MKIDSFAVIGHPIGHTMSPFIHKKLFELSGYSPIYEVLDVENVEGSLAALRTFDGFNITIPHKRNIIPFLEDITEKARVNGSVNTVKVEKGKMFGATTDGEGCRKALVNNKADLFGKILLLGNGGAARAIAFEAATSDCELTIAVRNKDKGIALKNDIQGFNSSIKINVTDFSNEENSNKKYDLLINTTSVGMYPKVSDSPVSKNVVERCGNVFDAVYNPAETVLLRYGRELNKNVIYGMDMLVFQAVAAHEFWYGGAFDKNDIIETCKEAQKEMCRIF